LWRGGIVKLRSARRVVVADRKGCVNVLDPLRIAAIEEARALPAGRE